MTKERRELPVALVELKPEGLRFDPRYAILPEEIEPTYRELAREFETKRKHDLEFCFRIGLIAAKGQLMLEAELSRTGQSGHGEKFFEQLERAIGLSEGTLRSAMRIVEVFAPERFEKLCASEVITPSHLALVVCLPDPVLRDELLDKAIEERLTVRELRQELRQRFGHVPRERRGGRPLKVPSNPKRAMTDARDVAIKFVRLNGEVWFGREFDIPREMKQTPADKLTTELKELAADCAGWFENVAAFAKRNAQVLRDTAAEIEQRMKGQEEYNKHIDEQLANS